LPSNIDNGAISGAEYSAKCEQLREREKKLTSQLMDARDVKLERDQRLDSLVREMGVSVKEEEVVIEDINNIEA
jgi:hypothetical protein